MLSLLTAAIAAHCLLPISTEELDSVVVLYHPDSDVNWQDLERAVESETLERLSVDNKWYVVFDKSDVVIIEEALIGMSDLIGQIAFGALLTDGVSTENGRVSLKSLDDSSRKNIAETLTRICPEWSELFKKDDLELFVKPRVEVLFAPEKGGRHWLHIDLTMKEESIPEYSNELMSDSKQALSIARSARKVGSIESFPWHMGVRVLKAGSKNYGSLASRALEIAQTEYFMLSSSVRELAEAYARGFLGNVALGKVLNARNGGDLSETMFTKATNAIESYRSQLGLSSGQSAESWLRNKAFKNVSIRLAVQFRGLNERGQTIKYLIGLPKGWDGRN